MQTDGDQILMIGPGLYEFGEAQESTNHQFGMLRAAAWLKDTGHKVEYIDGGLPPDSGAETRVSRLKERHRGRFNALIPCGNFENDQISKGRHYYGKPHDVIRSEMARATHPDEIWVGSALTYHWRTTAEIVEMANEMFPGCRIRVGGIYPSLAPAHARQHCPGADIWEGEIPEARSYWPDYSVFPSIVPFRTVKLNTGCTVAKACSFCAVKTLEPKFMGRDPVSLVDYLEAEIHKGVREVRVWASQLLQPPQAFGDLMDRLYMLQVKHGVSLHMRASEGVQPSLFTPDMARKMVRAGFRRIDIPMESIREETLEAFNKPSALSDYFRAVEIAKEAGASIVSAFIMIGTPQQGLDETVQAIVDCWHRQIRPAIMKHTIIPGSQDWEDFEWVHRGKDLEELHPSLWASARPGLEVIHLEEITAIARIGYERWRRLPQADLPFRGVQYRTKSVVDDLFVKWCKIYGLIKRGRFQEVDMVSPYDPVVGIDQVNRDMIMSSESVARTELVA